MLDHLSEKITRNIAFERTAETEDSMENHPNKSLATDLNQTVENREAVSLASQSVALGQMAENALLRNLSAYRR